MKLPKKISDLYRRLATSSGDVLALCNLVEGLQMLNPGGRSTRVECGLRHNERDLPVNLKISAEIFSHPLSSSRFQPVISLEIKTPKVIDTLLISANFLGQVKQERIIQSKNADTDPNYYEEARNNSRIGEVRETLYEFLSEFSPQLAQVVDNIRLDKEFSQPYRGFIFNEPAMMQLWPAKPGSKYISAAAPDDSPSGP